MPGLRDQPFLSTGLWDTIFERDTILAIFLPILRDFKLLRDMRDKGPVKIYWVPRPGFGKNLPEKKSSPPLFFSEKKS